LHNNLKDKFVAGNFDVIVIGAGPAGLFAAHELIKNKKHVLIIEKGKNIFDRKCPAIEFKRPCARCNTCDIISGWGGAGAFSDGKLTCSNSKEVGGHLTSYVDDLGLMIDEVLAIYKEYGAPDDSYVPNADFVEKFSRNAFINNLKFYPYNTLHLGTDKSIDVLSNMYNKMVKNEYFHIKFGDEILWFIDDRDDTLKEAQREAQTDNIERKIIGVENKNCVVWLAPYVIVAPGRGGSEWLTEQMLNHRVGIERNAVDVGVRMEVPAQIMEEVLSNNIFDMKLEYYSATFNDRVRTFCTCPKGEVLEENYNGFVTVNGHGCREKKTNNTNFSILVSINFTEPFNKPLEYGASIISLGNMLAKNIIVQRYGDLKRGRRSTEERIKKGFVEPTLKSAVPGDISFVLPYRHLKDIMEMIEAMSKIIPGINSEHNLLYATEVKFYSSKITVDKNMETKVKGLYVAGDGAGLTRGLMQASASGLHVARNILKEV